ncbi:radical SAM/SPASM domain-containing protein [Salidesulfovibrio onnuriiensis]|uniref:radical SAM/SPASM domain-containing protein n=1 Tax=Salidesulfovibrio onnuriiensis TaxID=2583823 RepID=UPI0011CB244F|nr:radical SAM/SPASM domain-containing protein [Salidesulfovibrio onnuriiensis]
MEYKLPGDPGRFPTRVTLELTNRCNLNCTFCPRCYMEKERGFLDTALAKELLNEMAGHAPVAFVPFFRGESLLHPQWFEILSLAQEKAVGEIQFTTNASLLSSENIERILDLDLAFISFSLDTRDPELYNASRRGADFEKTMQNVLDFVRRRDERGVGTQVQVSAVETPEHKPGMDAFVDYWRPIVDRVRVYVEHSTDGKPGSIDEPLPDFEKRLPCFKPFSDMVVYWNGQVACCNHDWTRLVDGSPLGDVSKDGIAGVWQGEPYVELRKKHLQASLDGVNPCDGCDHWKMYYMKSGYLGRTYAR